MRPCGAPPKHVGLSTAGKRSRNWAGTGPVLVLVPLYELTHRQEVSKRLQGHVRLPNAIALPPLPVRCQAFGDPTKVVTSPAMAQRKCHRKSLRILRTPKAFGPAEEILQFLIDPHLLEQHSHEGRRPLQTVRRAGEALQGSPSALAPPCHRLRGNGRPRANTCVAVVLASLNQLKSQGKPAKFRSCDSRFVPSRNCQ